ncbi:MAG: MFS transporter [Pseudomonadota bacterium]
MAGKAEERKQSGYAAYVLFMLLLLYTVNYVDRYLAAGLLEPIKASLDVSDTFMGFLIGPAFALFYTTIAIPIARLADERSRVMIISIGAVVWSAFTVLSGLSDKAWTFALARIGVGIGEAAFLAPAYSLLSDYFPPRRRAFAFAILNIGVYAGQISGLIGGAAIAEAYDWRMAFLLLGAPGVLLGALTWFTVREPARGRLDEKATAPSPAPALVTGLKTLWRTPSYRYMVIGSALGGFAGYGFGFWGPTLFARAFELGVTEANSRFGLSFGLSGLAGVLLCGWLSDRLASSDRRWPLRFAAGGVFLSMAFMILAAFSPSANLATFAAIPAGIFGGGWVVALQSAMQDVLPARVRATATSVWGFALAFSGLVGGVQFAGFATDMLAGAFDTQSIRYSLSLTLLASIPSAYCIIKAGESLENDTRALAASF